MRASLPPANALLLIPWSWRPENTLVRAGPGVSMDETWGAQCAAAATSQDVSSWASGPFGVGAPVGKWPQGKWGILCLSAKRSPLTPGLEVLATEKHCP